MFNPFKTDQRLKDLQSEVDCLRDLLQKHATTMAHELFKLKNPWYERPKPTVGDPLTEEQEKIVTDFFENNKLPEQIRRSFARGGSVGLRAAMGRFGEAPSEQLRSTDAVDPAVYASDEAVPTTRVDVTFDPEDLSYSRMRRAIAEMPLSRKLADYPGTCYRHPHLDIPPRGTATGFRDPQPPPRQKSMDEMIREEQRVMDQEAWDNMDLHDIDPPKE